MTHIRSPSRQDVQQSEAAIVITRPELPVSGDFPGHGGAAKINRSRRAALDGCGVVEE